MIVRKCNRCAYRLKLSDRWGCGYMYYTNTRRPNREVGTSCESFVRDEKLRAKLIYNLKMEGGCV